MADELDPAAGTVPAVVVTAPIVEPVVAAVAAVEPVAEPVAAVVPEPAAVVAEPAVKPHTETPTLLGEFGKEKPAVETAKPGDPTKPVDPLAPPVVEPAAVIAPVYEFKLPEGIKADPEKIGAYTAVLTENKIAPEVGQKLLDMHAATLTNYALHLQNEQQRVFSEYRAENRKKVMGDPEIGGAGHQTAMGAIARVRDALVPTTERAEFDNFLLRTGAGDDPTFLKMLHRAARFIDEPQARTVANGRPPKDIGKQPGRSGFRGIYNETTTQN